MFHSGGSDERWERRRMLICHGLRADITLKSLFFIFLTLLALFSLLSLSLPFVPYPPLLRCERLGIQKCLYFAVVAVREELAQRRAGPKRLAVSCA